MLVAVAIQTTFYHPSKRSTPATIPNHPEDEAPSRIPHLTYVCREITGLSRYRNAFVAAQNAIRATGMPTDIAMSTAVKMVSNIEAAPAAPDPGFSDCTIGVTRTKQELLDWGAKFRRSQR